MKKHLLIIIMLLLFLLPVLHTQAQERVYKTIPSKDTLMKHIGAEATVVGQVFGGKYLEKSGVTLLNLGDPYPDQVLTIVIRGDDRKKFKQALEKLYDQKTISVRGITELYQGKLQVVVHDTTQITIVVRTRKNY
jgi:hypothetical protein